MGKDGTQIRTLIHIYLCGFCKHYTLQRQENGNDICRSVYYSLAMSTCILHTRSINNSIIIIMCLPPASFFFVFSLATWMALIWKLGPQCCCCKNFEVHPPFQKLNRWRRKVEATKNGPNFLSVCDEERSLLACYV